MAPTATARGGTQLRLEATDALETHYSPRVRGGFLQHQPLALAHAAGATQWQLLGFTDVQRDGERATASTPEGYILTRFAGKYGPAVSFASAGPSDHPGPEQRRCRRAAAPRERKLPSAEDSGTAI